MVWDRRGITEARGYLDSQEGMVAELDGRIVGFLTYATEFPESMEVTWRAVVPVMHRRGVGHALIDTLIRTASTRGCEVLLVKMLAESHPSPEYALTRCFYRAMGFRRLTVLPEHWGPVNPCLLMVRPLV